MKVAYFSPFNPQKSGISDFSEEWLARFAEMKKEFDIEIDIFTEKPISNNYLQEKYTVRRIDEMNAGVSEEYDLKLYHVGNNAEGHEKIIEKFNQFPGILELHEISLHNLVVNLTVARNDVAGYLKLVEYSHGKRGLSIAENYFRNGGEMPWERDSLEMTVSRHLTDKAQAVIVHSDFVKQMIKAVNISIPVINIPLHTADIAGDYAEDQKAARSRLRLSDNKLIFASFGFATPSKRIIPILDALKKIKENGKEFLYIIVGELHDKNITASIKNHGLSENVVITGFTSLEAFKDYMLACDIAVNLRYPTQGESSAAVHRLMGMGKPIVVTNIGTFQEYPDNTVLKVRCDKNETDDIYKALADLHGDKALREKYSLNALKYAGEHFGLDNNIRLYCKFFSDIANNSFRENDIIDIVLDNIDKNLYFNREYMDGILKKLI